MWKKWTLFILLPIAILGLSLFWLRTNFRSVDDGGASIIENATPLKKGAKLDALPIALPRPSKAPNAIVKPEPISIEELKNAQEQTSLAMGLLSASNDQQRIEGAELLGAYPSPNSEAILIKLLQSDPNPEVRSVAALSLATSENPAETTIQTLINTLEDKTEDVRYGALSTLEDYLAVLDKGSPRYRSIHSGLIKKLSSKNLTSEMRSDIQNTIEDR
jgi:hypothetical protein